jgi:hypothetical protein
VDGKISLGLNPDGPVDRQIGLIRVERPDGTLIAWRRTTRFTAPS